MRTCVIVGQNFPDAALQRLVAEYGRVIIFEPLPAAADACRVAFWDNPGVIVFEAACGDAFGHSAFNVYNTSGLSSSLGTMTEDAVSLYGGQYDLSLKGTIGVQVLHLGFMLQMLGAYVIDFLLIDAQGMDFTILKTVEIWLAESRVKLIQLEAEGKGFRHYSGLPDNSEESIIEWMKRYPQYAAGRLNDKMAEQPDLVFELKEG
jgi:FkbM family methyltransferase